VRIYAFFIVVVGKNILSDRMQKLSVKNLEKHLIINWYNNKLSKSDCGTEQFLSDTHGTY
jgi:hypothetical protein